MTKYITLLICLCYSWSTWAQSKSMEQEWQAIVNKYDLEYYKKPNDVLKEIKALQQRPWSNDKMIRLKLWEIKTLPEIISSADNKTDSAARSILSTLNNPVDQSVVHILLADFYAHTFNNNKYNIIQRTANAISNPALEIDEWTITEYQQAIVKHINDAFADTAILKQTTVKQYTSLFTNYNNENYIVNHSMYDALLWKTVEILQNDVTITTPIDEYSLHQANHLKNYRAFNQLDLTHADLNNFKFRTIQALQALSRYYASLKNEEGLSKVDQLRLSLFEENQLPEDQAMLIEWNQKNYIAPAVKAYWQYRHIMIQLAKESARPIHERNIQPLYTQLLQIAELHPNTYIYNEVQRSIGSLKEMNYSAQLEEVVLPHVNNKFLFSYKNLETAYVYIYKNIPQKTNEPFDVYQNRVLDQKPIQNFTVSLPQRYPYQLHTTEIKIDPLDFGQYILVTGSKPLHQSRYYITFDAFQVSDLMVVNIGNQSSQVLSRTTGNPIVGATVSSKDNTIKTTSTDAQGYVSLKDENYYNAIVTYGKDVLVNTNINSRVPKDPIFNNEKELFLFTDRSIYRPGQQIYFKGIAVQRDGARSNNEVIANESYVVEFLNANYELISKQVLKTNEFGSFTGSFVVPETGLNGQYQIRNAGTWRSTFVQVDEYKRPKFYIEYDTLNDTYTLEKPITVTGKAIAYAGSNITDAQVKYTIKRNVSFHYPWRYYRGGIPQSKTIEIAQGYTTTKADGTFSVLFYPKEDQNINHALWPTYNYTISVTITDLSGETHQKEITVNAAKADLIIDAAIPQFARLKDLEAIKINTTNVNHISKSAKMQVKVHKLKAPKRLFAERKWDAPNAPLYDEASFRSLFPNETFENDADPANMALDQLAVEKTINGNEIVDLSSIKENGYYLLAITAVENGTPVEQKYYFHIYEPTLYGKPEAPLIIVKNGHQFLPGDTIKYYPMAKDENGPIWSQINTVTKRPILRPEHIVVREEDRGGISFQNYYVRNNRFYLAQEQADIPWTNKQLQIKWATHRDKLLPGSKETWQFTISGSEKEKVAAEMLVTLYDASLEDLKTHEWYINHLLRGVSTPYIYAQNVGIIGYHNIVLNTYDFKHNSVLENYILKFPSFMTYRPVYKNRMVGAAVRVKEQKSFENYEVADYAVAAEGYVAADDEAPAAKNNDKVSENKNSNPIRTNFNETAFFAPQLHTDQNGDIVYSFELPESLTKWNLKTIAHTKDWKLGQLSGTIQTQKDVMVIPNVPRYFRQGDEVVFSTKVANLTNEKLPVTAQIEILDANTLQSLNSMFGLNQTSQSTIVDAQGNVAVNWTIRVPESRYEPVIIRVTAQAGDHTDGEEHTLPVITNRTFVTTSSMLYMNGNGEKTQTFDAMQQAIKSPTVSNYKMTLEYVSNPTWYVVQALPYLTTYPYDCAEQIFSKFYGNAMSMHIVNQSPAIQQMLKTWKNDSTTFESKLAQNESLKTALITETPWATEAKDEKAQQQDILRLLDTKARSKELSENLNRLSQLQMSDGGFGWFKGHYSNPYITRTILHGLVRMKHINVSSYNQEKATYIVNRAYSYLDKELKSEYDALIKSKSKLDSNNLSYSVIHYLYTRSYEKPALSKVLSPIHTYFINQEKQYWTKYNPYMQGMIALTLHRNGEQTKAKEIVESLRQHAIKNDELGMYWNNNKNYYYWYEAPIEQQAVLIEAFQTIDPKNEELALMQTFLFKNKQTNRWHSTKATVDATYAILNNNEDLLNAKPDVALGVGNLWLQTKQQDNNPLGYHQSIVMGKDIKPEHSNISLKVSNAPNTLPSWGAVYYQYFEQTDKVQAATSAISIKKELYIVKNTNKGEVLEKISPQTPIKTGDKVRIKLTVNSDRDLEYVHVKDARAACLEPKDVISGYRRIGNVGAYQETEDISTNFFIDYLRKGTYILEYDTYANAKGEYSSGIATAQCMYAPEIISNSKGERITVQ